MPAFDQILTQKKISETFAYWVHNHCLRSIYLSVIGLLGKTNWYSPDDLLRNRPRPDFHQMLGLWTSGLDIVGLVGVPDTGNC